MEMSPFILLSKNLTLEVFSVINNASAILVGYIVLTVRESLHSPQSRKGDSLPCPMLSSPATVIFIQFLCQRMPS